MPGRRCKIQASGSDAEAGPDAEACPDAGPDADKTQTLGPDAGPDADTGLYIDAGAGSETDKGPDADDGPRHSCKSLAFYFNPFFGLMFVAKFGGVLFEDAQFY